MAGRLPRGVVDEPDDEPERGLKHMKRASDKELSAPPRAKPRMKNTSRSTSASKAKSARNAVTRTSRPG